VWYPILLHLFCVTLWAGAGKWWYKSYAKKAEDYAQLEKEEKEAKKGLWRDLGTKKGPFVPWERRIRK
jgi:hypothetical protein